MSISKKMVKHDRSVAAICIVWRDEGREDLVLIQKNPDYPHHLAGHWFFPGGKVEIDEQPIETAMRETKEECNIDVRNPRLIDVYAYTEYWIDGGMRHEQPIILVVYEALYTSGELQNSDECKESEWIKLSKIHLYLSEEICLSHLSLGVRTLLRL